MLLNYHPPGGAGVKGGTVNFFCTSVRADASGNSVEVRVADGAGKIPARASTDFDGDFFFIPNHGNGGRQEKAETEAQSYNRKTSTTEVSLWNLALLELVRWEIRWPAA